MCGGILRPGFFCISFPQFSDHITLHSLNKDNRIWIYCKKKNIVVLERDGPFGSYATRASEDRILEAQRQINMIYFIYFHYCCVTTMEYNLYNIHFPMKGFRKTLVGSYPILKIKPFNSLWKKIPNSELDQKQGPSFQFVSTNFFRIFLFSHMFHFFPTKGSYDFVCNDEVLCYRLFYFIEFLYLYI